MRFIPRTSPPPADGVGHNILRAVFLLDLQGQCIHASQRLLQTLGLPPSTDFGGSRWAAWLHPDGGSAVTDPADWQHGTTYRTFTLSPAGTRYSITRIKPIKEDGAIVGYLGVVRVLTRMEQPDEQAG